MACGNIKTTTQYIGGRLLSCMGVHVSTIKHAEKMILEYGKYDRTIAEIQRLAPPDVLEGPYVSGDSMLDAFCHTMCCGYFNDTCLPPPSGRPDRQQSRDELRRFLAPREEPLEDSPYLFSVFAFYNSRSFFTTEEGYIGVGPRTAKPGDRVCVLLGCPSPLLLRASGNMQG
jgi:hypothetical protein